MNFILFLHTMRWINPVTLRRESGRGCVGITKIPVSLGIRGTRPDESGYGK